MIALKCPVILPRVMMYTSLESRSGVLLR